MIKRGNDGQSACQKPSHRSGTYLTCTQNKTHPKAHALGWQGFESLAKLCDMPSMALGGMTYFDMNCAKIMVQKVLQELGG